ncbi:carbohydrate binding domain-containing protein [Algibacter sp. 2305UL17-15]|uniref:carbohydrate binding domain-containing protein n=1 Tax=Algibacter sp. 2305UL17-15 TaxID=3231268 RepID=UPI003459427B
MKTIKYLFSLSIVLLFFLGCAEDDNDLSFVAEIAAPSDVSAVFNIEQDNSGKVSITPNATGASNFNITLGDATEPVNVKQGESIDHVYAEGAYTITIVAVGLNGLTAETTEPLEVSFKAPENIEVVIENDVAVSKKVNITANADFAIMYEFYSGEDGVTQPVLTGNIGETISYNYENAGTYDVRVIIKGAAIETTEYTETFEVTEILAPITSAPRPRNRPEEDVISIYSAVYMDVPDTDYFPDWGQGGQGSSWAEFDLNDDKMLQYINLSYQGIALADGITVDVSNMEYLHLDVWTASEGMRIETSLINNTAGGATEAPVWSDLTTGEWTSIEIPISDYTDQGLTVTEIFQMKFVGEPWAEGTVFIDNIYFYKESSAPFNDGLLTNGDFESGSDPWIVGVDDNTPVTVVTDSGNTYYSVNVAAAGNPWEVNMSQKVEIIQDETYTLIFDAWSDTNRSIVSGIGLSADPWSSTTEAVTITPTKTTYSLTLVAGGFGALDARVIFDLGADAGMVNIDNVSLFLGDGPFDDGLLTNGDFEAGSDPWIVGVDDNAPITVVTDSGNTYYSVNVAAAGNPWEVNMSQKVEIIQDVTYTLTFDAWSDTNRSIVAGIGLSADPWSSETEIVDITTTRTTYTLTLTSTGFGALDARVIFDMGADAGMVNIDNVSLTSN